MNGIKASAIVFTTLLLGACDRGFYAMKLPPNHLSIPYVEGCAKSWSYNVDEVNMASEVLAQLDVGSGDFIAYKIGNETGGYTLLVMTMVDNEGLLVLVQGTYKEPLQVSIPIHQLDAWTTRLQEILLHQNQLVYGVIYKVSHLSCHFLLARKQGEVFRLFSLGIVNEGPIGAFLSDLETLLGHYREQADINRSGPFSDPLARDVDHIRWEVEGDIFFEIDHWLTSSQSE